MRPTTGQPAKNFKSKKMKDGTIICNAGHCNMETDVKALEALSEGKELVRDGIHSYRVDEFGTVRICRCGKSSFLL